MEDSRTSRDGTSDPKPQNTYWAYARSGSCKFGKRCHYSHEVLPRDRTASRSSACQVSKKLDKALKSEATAINNVKQKEDLFPGAFPDDEPNVALSPTEQADDSLIDESALLSDSSEPTYDTQIALDAQLSASSEEMAD
ncbi:hypothetical protein E4U61_001998 [Claviceps capensis]|nr:hypothetical protein E4U61_001998 [Claviceps capensis]